jgi:hypothetical protein
MQGRRVNEPPPPAIVRWSPVTEVRLCEHVPAGRTDPRQMRHVCRHKPERSAPGRHLERVVATKVAIQGRQIRHDATEPSVARRIAGSRRVPILAARGEPGSRRRSRDHRREGCAAAFVYSCDSSSECYPCMSIRHPMLGPDPLSVRALAVVVVDVAVPSAVLRRGGVERVDLHDAP